LDCGAASRLRGFLLGKVLIVEGRLLVLEPEGVRSGVWPGAVVIGSPVMAQRRNATDLFVVTLDDWIASPFIGTGDPAAVDVHERRYVRRSGHASFSGGAGGSVQQQLDL
jgi:hypothetical protein